MDRRSFGRALAFGAAGLAAAPLAAQYERRPMPGMGMAPMGPLEQRHALDTLAIGAVALRASQMAQERARTPRVVEFAGFEVAEQTTIAQIHAEMGLQPPPPMPMDRAMLDRLAASRGPGFERDYVMGQMDGHRRLLAVQDRYLSEGRDMHTRHLTMLARGQILEHICLLQDIQGRV